MNNHFKIIIPFYNVELWIKATVNSVKAQNYNNFQCIMIDDMSTDDTLNILAAEVGDDPRFKIIENSNKKYVLQNIIMGIEASKPNSGDIIVILDGDDWFSKKSVLSSLNQAYKREECWLTYGSYIEYPSGNKGKFAKQVPEHIIKNNSFRQSEWMTSHLRSWKYGLWEAINQERSFVEPGPIDSSNHFANCWDLAYMFPLLELAGRKSYFISDVLYVYNRQNPLNVDKLDHQLQLKMEQKIRNMDRYPPLQNLEKG